MKTITRLESVRRLTAAGLHAALSASGDSQTLTPDGVRVICWCRGKRRRVSGATVYSTIHTPPHERLTAPLRAAKQVCALLGVPVSWSAAQRHVSGEVRP